MANAIEILINAKDNASGTIQKTALSLDQLAASALASVATVAAIGVALQQAAQFGMAAAKGFAAETEQLDRLSYVTGLNNEQLQIFRRGMERNGLQAEQLNIALRFFQLQLASNRKELAMYGITSDNTFEALQQLHGALQGAGNETERTELAAKTLGMRNVELAQTVTEVAKNYGSEYATAVERGAVLSAQGAEQARALDNALDDFADTMRAFKVESAEAFTPMLKGATELLNVLNELHQRQRDWNAEAEDAQRKGLGLPDPNAPGMLSAHQGMAAGTSESFDPEHFKRWFRGQPPNPADILSGLSFSSMNETVRPRESAQEPLVKLEKLLERTDTAASTFVDTLSNVERGFLQAGQQVQYAMTNAITSVVTGAQTIGAAFRQFIMSVFQSIAEAIATYLAKQATGWLISGIGALVGGPAGVAIGRIGQGISGSSAQPAGGNTFVIQSIDAKTALQSLVSPTGSMRRANDRVLEVSMAGAL